MLKKLSLKIFLGLLISICTILFATPIFSHSKEEYNVLEISSMVTGSKPIEINIPKNLPIDERVIRKLIQQKEIKEALKKFWEEDILISLILTKKYYQDGDYQKALECLNNLIESKPNDAYLYHARSKVYQNLIIDKARAKIPRPPSQIDVFFPSFGLFGQPSDSTKSVEKIVKALEEHKNYVKDSEKFITQFKKDLSKAFLDIDKAVTLDGENPCFWFAKAELNEEIADFYDYLNIRSEQDFIKKEIAYQIQESLKNINTAIELAPECWLLYEKRAGLYSKSKAWGKAIEDYTQAINKFSTYPCLALSSYLSDDSMGHSSTMRLSYLYDKRASAHKENKQYEKAIEDLENSINTDCPSVSIDFLELLKNESTSWVPGLRSYFIPELPKLYKKTNSISRGINFFGNAILKCPNSIDLYLSRGDLYESLGKFDLALKDYNKAISLCPENPRLYYLRGIMHYKRGMLSLSLQDFDSACQINKNYCEFKKYLLREIKDNRWVLFFVGRGLQKFYYDKESCRYDKESGKVFVWVLQENSPLLASTLEPDEVPIEAMGSHYMKLLYAIDCKKATIATKMKLLYNENDELVPDYLGINKIISDEQAIIPETMGEKLSNEVCKNKKF